MPGADAKVPKLNKLGGTEWTKTKTKVRTAVREIAKELVELYAGASGRGGLPVRTGYGVAEGIRGDVPLR